MALGTFYQLIYYGNIEDKVIKLGTALLFFILAGLSASFSYIICFFCLLCFGFPSIFENIIRTLGCLRYINKCTVDKSCKFLHNYVRIPIRIIYVCVSYTTLLMQCQN